MARLKSGMIAVEGLDELRRALKKLEGDGATNALKDANYRVAELVVSAARGNTSSRMEAAAARTLEAGRAAARATASFGGAKAPFAMGAEFGAGRNQPRRTSRGMVKGWNQFKPWRGSGSGAGYWFYPAIRSETDHIVALYGDEIEKITREA